MKTPMRVFVVLTCLYVAAILCECRAAEVRFPPRHLEILAKDIAREQRPDPEAVPGGWRWDAWWPEPYMRSTDLVVSPDGELWFIWVEFQGELPKDSKSSLFLQTPSKRLCLRDNCDCLIANPAVAFGPLGSAVVVWREFKPLEPNATQEVIINGVKRKMELDPSAGARHELFLAGVKRDGELAWGPLLLDQRMAEASIAVDSQDVTHILARPGSPADKKTHFSRARPLSYYTVSAGGELIGKSVLSGLNAQYVIGLACDAHGGGYLTFMDRQTRFVAQIEETPEGVKPGEAQKMLARPEAALRDKTSFGDDNVLRARAFFDEDGTLLVDNLVWSRKEQTWKVIRVEYKPKNPVPGNPTPTIFVDPEGGLHINPP